ncbi:MAG: YlbF family regulator [Desulfitobacterium sp.]|nr:YlbF family regulator [Desulfitobacterium sp.]
MTAEIMEKAEALAAAIAKSTELLNMRSAEQAMMMDEQAQRIIAEFQNEQQRVYQIQAQGQQLTDTDHEAIAAMEAKVESYPPIRAYLQAQEQFTKMLNEINNVLAQAIANDPNGGACSTGPSGCSGCAGGC